MDNWNSKQKLIVKIVCLLLSISLWFYVTNIENPVKSYDMNKVPVELINEGALTNAGLALVPNQQFYVNLKLEGQSQDIFKVEKSDFRITVDLSEFVFKVGENKVLVNIAEAPNNISIKNSNGLAISLNIEPYTSKEVAVKSKIEVISKSSYYVATPTFNPSSVIVSGPESLVSKVDSVVAEGQESNAVETIIKSYKLVPVDENDNIVDGVNLSEEWSEATIPINEGKMVPIKINTKGDTQSDIRIQSIVSDVKEIGITGPQNLLDNITEIQTDLIDLSQITNNTSIDVSLQIPEGLLIQNGESKISVQISIEKIETKKIVIGYKLKGILANMQVVPTSDKITVTVSAYGDKLNELTEASFIATLDVSEFTTEGVFTKEPTVTLANPDESIKIISVTPAEIKVTKLQPGVSEDITAGEIPEDIPVDGPVDSPVDNDAENS